MNSYQPKNISNLQPYQQKPFANHQLSPMTQSPIKKQTSKVVFNHQNNTRQFVNTPARVGVYDFQNKSDMKSFQKPFNQTPNQTQAIKYTKAQQGKKFTPLSYKVEPKVCLPQQEVKSKQYAKQTLQIVMVGFVILILIIGSFYSLMLWNKMKSMENQNTNQLSLATNSNILNSKVKIQAESSKVQANQNTQWKTLPEEQKSPLGFLEHEKNRNHNQYTPHLRTMKIQPLKHYSQKNYIHRRKSQYQNLI